MNKDEFLAALRNRLANLAPQELEKTMEFYSESIDDRMEDGMSQEEAVADLGDIEKIVHSMEIETPLPELMKNKMKTSQKKSGNTAILIVVLVCGLPIIVLLFGLYVTVWAVVVSLFAAAVGILVGGLFALVAGFAQCFINGFALGGISIGGGLVCIGISLLFLGALVALCKGLFVFSRFLLHKIKGLFL